MSSPTQTRAIPTGSRRASRRPLVQHLVAADETSLAELEGLLATLPICSTGRVFVEIPDASWIGAIEAPGRMTVTWLDRSARNGDPGSRRGCVQGRALARAVTAWADEMLCADDDETRIFLLGGFLGTAEIVDHLAERHGRGLDSLHTPERFRLAAH
ncbi:SIP domain-containing protein [Microbacterium sp.]|uniref:SIP domain-containing protein n=1 Tax=Microbacterium sp. TaxID=51671 RepID=UPI001AD3977F|nr:SIP domain-containing protein [Microbacterium sp.]MBN9192727.1 SIP domain-containing protein [Microbacterium sp.]